MHHALRPFVTTGVALVGASVIAVAPIAPTPTDIHIPNPLAQVQRDVQLTAREFETAVNDLLFNLTDLEIRVAIIPAPLVAAILDISEPEAESFLALGGIGVSGFLISGTGAGATATQDVFDAFGVDFGTGLVALIGSPATIIDGIVNGGYGPDISELVIPLLPALPATIPVGTFNLLTQKAEPCIPGPTCLVLTVVPSYAGPIFAPGLITQIGQMTDLITEPTIEIVDGKPVVVPGALDITPTLPGFFPTLQALVQRLLDTVDIGAPADMAAVNSASDPVETLSVTNTDTPKKLLTLDVTPNLGVEAPGKGAAADLGKLPSNATDALEKAAAGATNATDGALGAVEDTLTTAGSKGGSLVRDSLKFVPETKASSSGGPSGSALTAVSDTLSSTAKNFGDAVSNAVKSATGLGGGSDSGGEE